MFFKRDKKNYNGALSEHEKKRLSSLIRYTPTETRVFGVPVFINDACTLLGDIRDIIGKGIYRFQAETPAPFILDCGANIGMSVVYFKRLYPNARIVAFEPDPTLFAMLSKNILNFSFDNVELRQEAVWINDQGIDFRTEGGHSGRISDNDNDNDNNVVSVPSARLKTLLETLDVVDMLKMDIEGAEADVLFDCGRVITKCKHIFIEYHSRKDKKQKLHEILKMFSDAGYRYHVQEAFVRKQPFVDRNCMVDMDLQLNLFFIKE